jgi:hypothetical protein
MVTSAAIQTFVAPTTLEKLVEIEDLVGSLSVAARLSVLIGSRRAREKTFRKLLAAPRSYSTGDASQTRIKVYVPAQLNDLIAELAHVAGSTSAAARALLSVGADDVYQLLIADFKGAKR